MTELSHLDAQGRARMVDVGDKDETERRARAAAQVTMSAGTLAAIEGGGVPKGDVWPASRPPSARRSSSLSATSSR